MDWIKRKFFDMQRSQEVSSTNKWGLLLFSLSCILSCELAAKILDYEILNPQKYEFSLKEACSLMGVPQAQSLIIQIENINSIDCMGFKGSAGSICEKKFAKNLHYLRGHFAVEDKKLICETGQRVTFQYDCTHQREEASCQNSLRGCQQYGALFAKNLNLYRHSLTHPPKGDVKYSLNCHFLSTDFFDKNLAKKLIELPASF